MNKRAICLMTALGLLCSHTVNAHDGLGRYRKELEPLILDFMHRQQIPGLAIAIVNDNQVVYERGFGWNSLDRRRSPVNSTTVFHMASIVKPFIATAVLQLAADGKIDLDASVLRYLPYFKLADDRYQSITVRQLVDHTSGMPDVEDYEWDQPAFDDKALERYVRGLTGLNLLSDPGKQFAYSNIGYDILGDLIAKVSDESVESFVQTRIFKPLSMNSSTLLYPEIDSDRMSDGHVLDIRGNPAVSETYPYNRIHTPSSNLHSNVVDMTKWAIANMNHGTLDQRSILPAGMYSSMWKPAVNIGDAAKGTFVTAEGISWYLGSYRNHFFVTHSGGDLGFITDLAMLPDQHIAVVWMVNCDWIDDGPLNGPLTYAALDVALGLKPKPITLKRSLSRTLYFTYQRAGVGAAISEYWALKKKHQELYKFSEPELDEFGSRLLADHKARDAVAALRLQVRVYPRSARAQLLLAKAYHADGSERLSLAHYRKALRIDPTVSDSWQPGETPGLAVRPENAPSPSR